MDRRGVVVIALALTGACTGAKYGASFKTLDGVALAKPGVSPGRTNIVRVADAGGPLARTGIFLFGAIAAAGAVNTTSRVVSTTDVGDYRYTTVETTTTVDPAKAAAAQAILDEATSDRPNGLLGSLEVAAEAFGGDTSGFRYEIGAGSGGVACGPHLTCMFYVGLGIGHWTFHDRTTRQRSGTTVTEQVMDESDSSYFGTPVRLTVAPTSFLALYVQADLNLVTVANLLFNESGSPSPWYAGVELRMKWLFARAGIAAARLDADSLSPTLEAGLGF